VATYKLLALDLDGTLLDSSLRLSDGNAEALRRAMAAGVQVVLATTRWFGLAKRTADRLAIDTPLICSNGAVVKRPGDGEELLHLYLDADCAREVTTLGDDSGWEMYTAIGDATYMKMRPGIIPEKLPGGLRVADRQSDHLAEGAATSVLVYSEQAVSAIEKQIMPKYAGRANFSLNRPVGNQHYVVVNHPDAEKARALELVCRELGIAPDETLAMGDSESDIEMLRLAGLGIAMGNSPDALKREALHIAPTNDADGVAWAVQKFLL
jgi:Cof subfamily protein (haloacid dehalogenase superfamily)